MAVVNSFIFVVLTLSVTASAADNLCPSGWTFDGESFCYTLTSLVYNKDGADRYCQANGGQLATLATSVDEDGVIMMASNLMVPPFMGAHKNTNGTWVYDDGSTLFSFIDFAPGEPNEDNGDCATFHSVGKVTGLQATPCYSLQPALCRQQPALCNGGSFTGRSGSFNSPGYPVAYYNNLNCHYQITGPADTHIAIDFDPCDIEGSSFDYIVVYEGNTTDKEIGRVTDTDPTKASFETFGNQMLVVFITDKSRVRKGWLAQWKAISATDPVVQNASRGEMSSPNYPNDYGAYLEQMYYITAPNGFVVNATFDDFVTETNFDMLSVYDAPTVDSNAFIGNYTGNYTAVPFGFVSSTNTVTMRFITDGSVFRRGWHMSWIAV